MVDRCIRRKCYPHLSNFDTNCELQSTLQIRVLPNCKTVSISYFGTYAEYPLIKDQSKFEAKQFWIDCIFCTINVFETHLKFPFQWKKNPLKIRPIMAHGNFEPLCCPSWPTEVSLLSSTERDVFQTHSSH